MLGLELGFRVRVSVRVRVGFRDTHGTKRVGTKRLDTKYPETVGTDDTHACTQTAYNRNIAVEMNFFLAKYIGVARGVHCRGERGRANIPSKAYYDNRC